MVIKTVVTQDMTYLRLLLIQQFRHKGRTAHCNLRHYSL